jgi:adenylylsulfate kinase-like enzyme
VGQLIWITGLPGCGKTTLAKELTRHLKQRGEPVVHLDGDQLRAVSPLESGYTRESRLVFSRYYQGLARILIEQDVSVVLSTVSLFKEIHTSNREIFKKYFEVLLDVDYQKRVESNREHLYAQSGLVPGVSQEIDIPEYPDLILRYHPESGRSTWLNSLILSVERA